MKTYYYDRKFTIWQRTYLPEGVDIEQEKKDLKEDSVDNIEGERECEILYDTMERMSPEDNNNESTIELIEDNGMALGDVVIWDNKPKDALFETLSEKLKP